MNFPSLPSNGRSAGALAEETGLPQPTLSRWLREAHKVGVMNTPARKWTLVEKLRVLIEASRLDESKLGEFLRREGVHEAQLKQWRAEVEAERWGGSEPKWLFPTQQKTPLDYSRMADEYRATLKGRG